MDTAFNHIHRICNGWSFDTDEGVALRVARAQKAIAELPPIQRAQAEAIIEPLVMVLNKNEYYDLR